MANYFTQNRPIIIWLFTGCLLIATMVVVGGITRLTGSGLSIVEWDVIMGTLPPLNEAEWELMFEKYKQTPQYIHENFDFSTEDFKSIFWWEYIHRLIGRIIGIVFLVPFLYFYITKKINKELLPKLLIIFFMGGFQGFLGWFMVKSGLSKDPMVSHYRLAAHLITAFLTFGYTFWVALGLIYSQKTENNVLTLKIKKYLNVFFAILLVQIIYGAFVAGLRAGKICNTFPLMCDSLVPDIFSNGSLVHTIFESHMGVQFIHRTLAYIVFVFALFIWWQAKKQECFLPIKKAANILVAVVSLQFLLGVITILYAVPISMGVIHQLGAFLLFAVTLFSMHRVRFQ
jgi:cytochrome c oxidase assembly protein subunit 15